MSAADTALLAGIVAVAFLVEAAAGFGSMVVALTVGALLFPIPSLLGWLVPVNIVLSCYLVAVGRKHVDGKFLLVIVPMMLVGLLLGMAIAHATDTSWLKPVFAVFVIAVALQQLFLTTARPLPRGVGPAALLVAGVIHGVFATGGPLAVFVAARTLADKAAFRATLSVVWVVLNCAFLPRLWLEGTVTFDTLPISALMLAPLFVGIGAGEWIHHRLDEARFRRVVAVLLMAAGTTLLVTSLKAAAS